MQGIDIINQLKCVRILFGEGYIEIIFKKYFNTFLFNLIVYYF